MLEMLASIIHFYTGNPDKLLFEAGLLIAVIFLWKQVKKKQKQLIEAKNEEINRLIDDNNTYRDVYLVKLMEKEKEK
ncbi:MAG: hypothetical protein B0D92_01180 [Spirochaeta sp. LUC14_002_19_P3]|nr:MAG: hypothetical protein B0D92_01180 [Spirochaeta sp. LUC14_002_19_P3]